MSVTTRKTSMDDRTKLREMLASLTRQIEALEHNRTSIETTLRLLDEQDGPTEPSRPGRMKGTLPDVSTNVGRAVNILRMMAPQGLTLLQLIEKSAENGQKAFVGTSISSQLRFQCKRGFVKKVGDRYHAVIQ
jgi:hypothetical protein